MPEPFDLVLEHDRILDALRATRPGAPDRHRRVLLRLAVAASNGRGCRLSADEVAVLMSDWGLLDAVRDIVDELEPEIAC